MLKGNESKIEFSLFRNSIVNLPNRSLLYIYLKELFKDLSNIENSIKGISKFTFIQHLGINYFISEKLFISLNKSRSGVLSIDEFCDGMSQLYSGNFESIMDILFDLYDFNLDGKACKEDIMLILSHIPVIKQKNYEIECQLQDQYLMQVEEMLNSAFHNKNKMDKEEFIHLILNKYSDIIFLILTYFYKNVQFNHESVNAFKFYLNSKEKMTFYLETIFITYPSRLVYSGVNLYDFTSLNHENDIIEANDNINILPSINCSSKFFNSTINSNKNDIQSLINKEKSSESQYSLITNITSDTEINNNSFENNFKEKNKYEGEIYKFTEKNIKPKKYHLVLIKKDIYYYKDSTKVIMEGMHNLSGCFVEKGKNFIINDVEYFSFQLIFFSKVRVYFTLSLKSRDEWINRISHSLDHKNIMDDYEIENDIGVGKFGDVKLGINKKTFEKVAIKILNKKRMNISDLELAKSEIDIVSFCKHRNIIRFIESYENYKYIYIIFEHVSGGDLFDYINEKNFNINEDKVKKIIKQISLGISYLHKYGIMHRDIKPENILLKCKSISTFTCVKIIDLGLSKIIGIEERAIEGYGTICYVAPEILQNKAYDKKIDIWSIGIILYYILSKKLPFDDENQNEEKIGKLTLLRHPEFSSRNWGNRSKESMELIKQCLIKNNDKRIDIFEFMKHVWLKE